MQNKLKLVKPPTVAERYDYFSAPWDMSRIDNLLLATMHIKEHLGHPWLLYVDGKLQMAFET